MGFPQGGEIAVQDEGVSILPDALALDFRGTAVTVTSPGGGVARVTIDAAAGVLNIRGATAATDVFSSGVTGDATNRFVIDADGTLNWGDGTAALDTNLYRAGASAVKTDDSFLAGAAIYGAQGTNQVGIGNLGPAGVAGITFGTAGDTNLYRSAANTLTTDDAFQAASMFASGAYNTIRALASDAAYIVSVTGDTANRLNVQASGQFNWGSGAAPADTILYRSAANVLATDDALLLNSGTLAGAASNVGGRLYFGTGAPNNANGTNGDIYFDTAGGLLTTMYQRRAGVWVGIV